MRTFFFAKRFGVSLTVITLSLFFLFSAREHSDAVDLIISHPFPARHVQHRLLL